MSNEQKAASVEFDEDAARDNGLEGFRTGEFSLRDVDVFVDGARFQFDKDAAVIAGLKSRIKDFEACEFEWEQARRREISKDKEITVLKEEAEVHKKNAFYEMSKLAPLREEIERLKADYGTCDAERDTLRLENEKYRSEMDKITNGIPSEWAYSILKKERDELKAENAKLKAYDDNSTVNKRNIGEIILENDKFKTALVKSRNIIYIRESFPDHQQYITVVEIERVIDDVLKE